MILFSSLACYLKLLFDSSKRSSTTFVSDIKEFPRHVIYLWLHKIRATKFLWILLFWNKLSSHHFCFHVASSTEYRNALSNCYWTQWRTICLISHYHRISRKDLFPKNQFTWKLSICIIFLSWYSGTLAGKLF